MIDIIKSGNFTSMDRFCLSAVVDANYLNYLLFFFLQVSKQSRKFCPEALLFLRTLLNAALDEKQGLPENRGVCSRGL